MDTKRALPHRYDFARWLDGEHGLETVEYALISGIVIAMLAIAVPPLTQGLLGAFNSVTSQITNVLSQM